MHPMLEEFRKLPLPERMKVAEAMWDDIYGGDESLTLPGWVRDEVVRRMEELDANPSIGLTREQVWQQVDRPHG